MAARLDNWFIFKGTSSGAVVGSIYDLSLTLLFNTPPLDPIPGIEEEEEEEEEGAVLWIPRDVERIDFEFKPPDRDEEEEEEAEVEEEEVEEEGCKVADLLLIGGGGREGGARPFNRLIPLLFPLFDECGRFFGRNLGQSFFRRTCKRGSGRGEAFVPKGVGVGCSMFISFILIV